MERPKTLPTDSHLQLKNVLYYYQQEYAVPLPGPAASPSETPNQAPITAKPPQGLPAVDPFAALPTAPAPPGHSLPEALAQEDKHQHARLGRFLLTVTASWLGLTLIVALLLRT